jgi:hypothetical protein
MTRYLAASIAACALLAGAPPVLADDAPAPAGASVAARPDLTGTWTNASLTELSRPRGVAALVVDEAQAQKMAAETTIAGVSREVIGDVTYSDPNAPAPEKGGADFGLRGYDAFWVAPGERLAKVKGEYRTSYIVDPPSGQIPYSAAARPLLAEQVKGFTRYVTGIGGNTGPETTNLAERCLIGFGQTGGPGMLSVLYNNTYEIVQAPDHVMILVEMNHDARVVPIFATPDEARASHKPPAITKWLGDSVGWYEGGALVVETRNVHPAQLTEGAFLMSKDTVVTERFSRFSPTEIFYEFKVEDPTLYSQPWKAELSFYPATGRQYEYACHEGNYSMPHMLAGARLADQQAAEAAAAKAKPKGRTRR